MDALAQLDNAKRILAQVSTVDQAKELRDKAAAIAAYMKQQGDSLEVQQYAAEIKLRAERKLGELLKGQTGHSGGSPSHRERDLPDGISYSQSHRWQRIASLAEKDFESYLVGSKERQIEITTAGALKLVKRQAGRQPDEEKDALSVASLEQLIAEGRKFGTIYADPPWQYENQGTRSATDTQYRTMGIDDICALPVKELAADRSHLHLWTTNAFLFDAKRVMEAWGFEYKSCFIWCKEQMGIGNYWRVSHEFLLLGVRGNLTFADHSEDMMSYAIYPRTRHSAKPGDVRRKITRASPGPRLELFGRHLADGWEVWGNEVESTMFDKESA